MDRFPVDLSAMDRFPVDLSGLTSSEREMVRTITRIHQLLLITVYRAAHGEPAPFDIRRLAASLQVWLEEIRRLEEFGETLVGEAERLLTVTAMPIKVLFDGFLLSARIKGCSDIAVRLDDIGIPKLSLLGVLLRFVHVMAS